jgi:hypothetical protein
MRGNFPEIAGINRAVTFPYYSSQISLIFEYVLEEKG